MGTTTNDTNCTRCKGRGRGDWVVQHGICFACQGAGTRAAQVALREKAAAAAKRASEVEEVSILVGPVAGATPRDRRQAANIAYFEAFLGADRAAWGMSPVLPGNELAAGWYAFTVPMHVASFLAELEDLPR